LQPVKRRNSHLPTPIQSNPIHHHGMLFQQCSSGIDRQYGW
jgi:hypothetical protein